MNAVYCPADDTIDYSTDFLGLLDTNLSRWKNMGTVIILAHEFGHHVTDLHQRPFQLRVGRDLQADCYGGCSCRRCPAAATR